MPVGLAGLQIFEKKLLQSIMGLWTWIMGLPHVVSWTFFFT